MVKSLHRPNAVDTVQKHMRTHIIVSRKALGVAEAEVDMALCGEVEDGIDLVVPKTSQHVLAAYNVAVEETEIWPTFEHACIVKGAAVVQLIERDDIIRCRILHDKMSYQP